MALRFIACYTVGTEYEREIEHLHASLHRFDLAHWIEPYQSRGTWLDNCWYIPEHIRKAMRQFPEECLVYLDADAVVQRIPSLLFDLAAGDCELAIHHLLGCECLDGTLFVRPSQRTMDFVDEWISRRRKNEWEQATLGKLIPSWVEGRGLRFRELPPEYCLIFDHERQMQLCSTAPAIIHYQASRRFAKAIGHIPETSEELLRTLPRPIAVVGNGPIRSDAAHEIDCHASVIRINNFPAKPGPAGNKVTAWCVNCWPDVPGRSLGCPVFTLFHPDRDPAHDVRGWMARTAMPHLILPVRHWSEEARTTWPEKPSTGLILLHALAALEIPAVAYGFEGLRGGHYWAPDHVHDHADESPAYDKLTRIRFVRA